MSRNVTPASRRSSRELGQALRAALLRRYPSINEACRQLDMNPAQVRRCWTTTSRPALIDTVVTILDRLGYHTEFTIHKKPEFKVLRLGGKLRVIPIQKKEETSK